MRVLAEGVYDIYHFGHANGLRQAKEMGHTLVVGVNSSESAAEYKNKPVMEDNERIKMVQSCKWADEVVGHIPYVITMDVVKKLNCQLIAHGNDQIMLSTGSYCYDEFERLDMYRSFERTEYISTTELVERMLNPTGEKQLIDEKQQQYYDFLKSKFYVPKERFGRIAYIDGSFDLYHAGHASIIEAARQKADFLIIGLHSDADIIDEKNLSPILNQDERMLALSSNKNVDELVFDAPIYPDEQYIAELGISEIFCGKGGSKYYKATNGNVKVTEYVSEFSYLSGEFICQRIKNNRKDLVAKIENKKC